VDAEPVLRVPVRCRAAPTPALVALAAVLFLALGLQLLAFGHGGHDSISDLPRVFLHRHVGPRALPYLERPVEYPVLAGAALYVATLVWPTALGVLLVTAVAAAGVCLVVMVVLFRRFGARAWRWALALPFLLYAYQNWDVFAIAGLVVGLLLFERGRDTAAGIALGLGAAVKLFPAIAVPPLVAIRWVQGDRAGARRLSLAAVGAFVAVNLPVLLANPAGWWWPYAFQSRRQATWGTAWFYGLRELGLPVHGNTGAHVANVVSLVALLAGLGWLVVLVVVRRLDPFAVAAAAVAIFVLANKVYSPTYDVWLVACFVMVPLSRRLWVSFCAVDLAVFVTVYGYFHGVEAAGFVRTVLPALVVIRTAILLVLVARCTRGSSRVPTRLPSVPQPSRSR
jgi:hypothetical protein